METLKTIFDSDDYLLYLLHEKMTENPKQLNVEKSIKLDEVRNKSSPNYMSECKRVSYTIDDLKPGVFNTICNLLDIERSISPDYTGLATELGFTKSDVYAFELNRSPTEEMLINWGSRRSNNVLRLMDAVKNIQRYDVWDILRNEIQHSPCGCSKCSSIEEWNKGAIANTGIGFGYKLKRIVENIVKDIETQTNDEHENDDHRSKTIKLEYDNKILQNQLKKSYDDLEKCRTFFLELTTKIGHLTKKNNELTQHLEFVQNKWETAQDAINRIGRDLVEKEGLLKMQGKVSNMMSVGISVSTQTAALEASTSTSPIEAPSDEMGATAVAPKTQVAEGSTAEVLRESQQESGDSDSISLSNVPTTTVERSVYNHYKILLLMIAHRLLMSDVVQFKEWVADEFQIDHLSEVWEILQKLDQLKMIGVRNLMKLREFFDRIIRIDLVHLIDCFNNGDYTNLTDVSLTGTPKSTIRLSNNTNRQTVTQVRNRARQTVTEGGESSTMTRSDSNQVDEDNRPRITPVTRSGSNQALRGAAHEDNRPRKAPVTRSDSNQALRGAAHEDNRIAQVTRSPVVTNEPNQDDQGSSSNGHAESSRPQGDLGSNGQKLSKFQRSDSDNLVDETEWLCSHYKRRCRVKFSCCDEYWPCHRCHNHESKCGQKKLKSRDTKFLKCEACGTEQEFNEGSQHCTNCNKKFAQYFCARCKHLTGTDDSPYHCDRCGICRIHRDRSFHCDVCGVCLDVQLRGNHKCRAGSAHDECCICLEDAFTGCQILPCSHKVHKECASQMIRNGITRCPICRESFAHKLERRPIGTKKRDGKK